MGGEGRVVGWSEVCLGNRDGGRVGEWEGVGEGGGTGGGKE